MLHKSLIKHACLRGRASHVWGPRIWLSEGPPKQASRVQTLSVEVCINHRSSLPVSLAKHMSPKVRGPVSKTRWGEMREDPGHQPLVSCIRNQAPACAHTYIHTHISTSSTRQIFKNCIFVSHIWFGNLFLYEIREFSKLSFKEIDSYMAVLGMQTDIYSKLYGCVRSIVVTRASFCLYIWFFFHLGPLS